MFVLMVLAGGFDLAKSARPLKNSLKCISAKPPRKIFVQELANQHATIRQMLGHGDWADDDHYQLQTLQDNLRWFTPPILERISQAVVNAGHQALKISPDDGLHARGDSFVVETHVHFPTDINLLHDAARKVIVSCAELSEAQGLAGWRQSAYRLRQFKKS